MKYTAQSQPKDEKQILAFSVSFFFAFNLLAFGPAELYLTNITDLLISFKAVACSFVPVTLAVFAVLFIICLFTKGKAHIAALNIVFGLGLAFYIQGNYMQSNAHLIDGTKIEYSPVSIVINTLLWALFLAAPWILFRANNEIYSKVLTVLSLGICFIELFTASFLAISIVSTDEDGTYSNLITGVDRAWCFGVTEQYTYSKNKNYIIILTDEYDSFAFDSAIENFPDAKESFKGFTYYRNTVGMYGLSQMAIRHILTGESYDDASFAYKNDNLFSALRNTGYTEEFYMLVTDISEDISKEYAVNYNVITYSLHDYAVLGKNMYKLVMYKYSPMIFKSNFYMYTGEFTYELSKSSNIQSFFAGNLNFYNSIKDELTLSDDMRFKIIYLPGLHSPLNLTSDLETSDDWTVTPEEQAAAVNKILAAYLDNLRKTAYTTTPK